MSVIIEGLLYCDTFDFLSHQYIFCSDRSSRNANVRQSVRHKLVYAVNHHLSRSESNQKAPREQAESTQRTLLTLFVWRVFRLVLPACVHAEAVA